MAIIILIWVIGAIFAYDKVISKWDNSAFEKVWFSAIWPLCLFLYVIHLIHNRNEGNKE